MNRRGVTLLELLIALGVTSMVVAVISIVLVKQSQASVKQTQQRTLEETGRQALLEIAYAVRMAGSGIDPRAAFDFDRYACSSPGTAGTCNNNPGIEKPTPTAAAPGLRDKTDGPDELVVSYRDPVFWRNVTAISGSDPYTVTLDALGPALKNPVRQGRIAMLLCSGADPVSYLAFAADAAAGATTVSLRSIVKGDGYYPQALPADTCFGKGMLVLVERVRYFVANDFDGVPALFRDRGRAGDPQVLFRGIEDLQLTYTIGPPPAGSALTGSAGCGSKWVYGLCNQSVPDEAATAPDWINDSYDNKNRFSGHPANIRSLEINLIARATQRSPDKAGDPVPTIANRPGRAADQFTRSIFKLTEQTPNLLARAMLMPDGGG
jgi:type II secretory pathway pseudopilin PulG